ncbi:MAG: ABC transporter substrate-binding protein [Deinococcota bacterium]
MHPKTLAPVLVTFVFSFALAQFPVTVTDDAGNNITFDAAPERVVVVREELLELLVSLDIQPVGYGGRIDVPQGSEVTTHAYLSAEQLGTPVYIGEAQGLSLERIVLLNPDLILFPNDGGAEGSILDELAAIAPTLAFNPQARGSWQDIIVKLGEVLDKEAQAEAVLAAYAAKVAEVRADVAETVASAPRTAIVYLPSPDSTWILGSAFALGGLAESLGFEAVAPAGVDLGPFGASEVSLEAFFDLETDAIFTIQFSEGVQEGFQAETMLAAMDVPIMRVVLAEGRPYTGPISEVFYMEQFRDQVLKAF